MMNKKVINRNGKEYYLLGTVKLYAGTKFEKVKHLYLEKESWDCGWYWGLGCLVMFTNDRSPETAKDIDGWNHFDSTFFKDSNFNGIKLVGRDPMERMNILFEEMVLDEKEQYKLWEIMKSLYTLRATAELLHIGGSHVTNNPCHDILKDEDMYWKINKEMMPALFKELRQLLSPAE